ncbi:MAG: NAD(P)-binding domain-containing protein, partial [Chloroflexota bacterium]|nr:NAD(P)-binding domain-containing protein [Chloroflexota bacterium]
MQRVAVLGLGIIGSGIAQNLLGAGFPLAVYNRSRARAEQLGAMGARVAPTPGDAARDADVVIAAVANDEASEA